MREHPAPQLIKALRQAKHVVAFTGAGVSADSGIATFRDRADGLWGRYDPSSLATPEAFERDPSLVWGWYEWRRGQVAAAKPNAAHLAIASLEQLVPKVTVITQNVDDLHERAGSSRITHLHGSQRRTTLPSPCYPDGSLRMSIRSLSRPESLASSPY